MEATQKMKNFAGIIASVLEIEPPNYNNYKETHDFIQNNSLEYWENVTPATEILFNETLNELEQFYKSLNFEMHERFRDNLDLVDNTHGVYLLWSGVYLAYIGKSTNLKSRIVTSMKERNTRELPITSFTLIPTKTVADMHILEPLLISELNPILNKDFKCDDKSIHFNSNLDYNELFGERRRVIKNETEYSKNILDALEDKE